MKKIIFLLFLGLLGLTIYSCSDLSQETDVVNDSSELRSDIDQKLKSDLLANFSDVKFDKFEMDYAENMSILYAYGQDKKGNNVSARAASNGTKEKCTGEGRSWCKLRQIVGTGCECIRKENSKSYCNHEIIEVVE